MLFNSLLGQSSTSNCLSSFNQIQGQESLIDGIKFRNIGPSIMSGRIVDLEVNPSNTKEFFVAYASGGIWHTDNNGLSFEPIFDNEATHTIGDMSMDWKHDVLWVGTGEVNSSRSSYAGTGVYKTTNRGKTWEHMGLEETHHIGRIEVNPSNPNDILVAALGHLYSYNRERGVFRSRDGGKSWQHTLYVNDSTGVVDLVVDPTNPKIVYASSWTRSRTAWNFNGSGEGSAIYKSNNGGGRWEKISGNGFPQGKGVGRIGLSVCASQPNVLYAFLDNNFHQKKKKGEKKKLQAKDFLEMDMSGFENLDDDELDDFLKQNGYPKKYTAESLRSDIEADKYSVEDIGKWRLADADASLFETPIIGAELYRSNDGGASWNKTHENLLDGIYFTYGYYFGTIQVSPMNPDKVWLGGYPLLFSEDGGANFKRGDGENCHPDYHRIWINPKDEKHLIVGNDGGINLSYDEGGIWYKANAPAVGQFYAIQVDNEKPYNVYGGLQDNGTWFGSSAHKEDVSWLQEGKYAFSGIGGGDGMQVMVDTRNNLTTYLGWQFGNYMRINKENPRRRSRIKPVHDIGEKAYRFNWQTPILLSKHNQDVFYYGSNKFHRSLQKGDDLETLSDDLTTTQFKGNVPYGSLTSISESPKKFGLLYVGTDDGNIWRSKDVGYTWDKISTQLPQNLWVSRVWASKHEEGRVYASLNAYRFDDFKPYVYMSADYGETWTDISSNLPDEPINVIKEDKKEDDILYVGTDNGLYVSTNTGSSWMPWRGNFPRVAVHDLVIQERENELVVGTHGRSIYIGKLDLVQKLNYMNDKAIEIVPISEKEHSRQLGSRWSSYAEPYTYDLPIQFFVQNAGPHVLNIRNDWGKKLKSFEIDAKKGWNEIDYQLDVDESALKHFEDELKQADDEKYYLPVGEYEVQIVNENGQRAKTPLLIIESD